MVTEARTRSDANTIKNQSSLLLTVRLTIKVISKITPRLTAIASTIVRERFPPDRAEPLKIFSALILCGPAFIMPSFLATSSNLNLDMLFLTISSIVAFIIF